MLGKIATILAAVLCVAALAYFSLALSCPLNPAINFKSNFQPSLPNKDTEHPKTSEKGSSKQITETKSPSAFFNLRVSEPNKIEGAYYAETGDGKKHEWVYKFWCEIRIGEFIIALFTVCLVGFTGLLWWSTDELRKATTNAAQSQADDTRILQRAYIAVEPFGIALRLEGDKLIGHILIVNAGNLPAENVAWFLTVRPSGRGDEIDFPLEEPKGKIILAPKATAIRGSAGTVSLSALSDAAGSPNDKVIEFPQFLYVWGVVRYSDGFNKTRTTKFCHRYNWKMRGEGGVRAVHPHYSIDPQYARYHEHGNDAD